MDKLFEELAKTLNVSTDFVQQMVGNYPQLRSQYTIYSIIDRWANLLSFSVFVLLVVVGILWLKYHSEVTNTDRKVEVNPYYKRWFKCLIISIVVLIVCTCILLSVQPLFAPDVTVLLDIINHLKN